MYKQDLALNNQQWFICHKTQKKTNHIYLIYMYKQDSALNILDETHCISHSTNTLGKGMNPIILPPAMGK